MTQLLDIKVLDVYCCEGAASRGIAATGASPYGIDLFKHKDESGKTVGFSQKRYPYPSVQMDAIKALTLLARGERLPFVWPDGRIEWLGDVDFAWRWASPPCQHASAGTRALRQDGKTYPALIEPTRELLQANGKPFIIENVKGAALRDPIVLCGTMFGLKALDADGTPLEMWRHRMFESNVEISAPHPCAHGWHSQHVAGSYGGSRRAEKQEGLTLAQYAPLDRHAAKHERHGGYVPRSAAVQAALLGVSGMTIGGMGQCVPPAFAEHLARQVASHLELEAAA